MTVGRVEVLMELALCARQPSGFDVMNLVAANCSMTKAAFCLLALEWLVSTRPLVCFWRQRVL